MTRSIFPGPPSDLLMPGRIQIDAHNDKDDHRPGGVAIAPSSLVCIDTVDDAIDGILGHRRLRSRHVGKVLMFGDSVVGPVAHEVTFPVPLVT